MKKLAKILPSICVILFVLFLIIWQLSDWTLIRVLPYLILGVSLTVTSFAVSIASDKRMQRITWVVWFVVLTLHLLLLSDAMEMQSAWESLIILGTGSIFIYLFELTRRGCLFGKYTTVVATIPIICGLVSLLVFLFLERFLGIALLALIASAVLAITGLLFGFRKSH